MNSNVGPEINPTQIRDAIDVRTRGSGGPGIRAMHGGPGNGIVHPLEVAMAENLRAVHPSDPIPAQVFVAILEDFNKSDDGVFHIPNHLNNADVVVSVRMANGVVLMDSPRVSVTEILIDPGGASNFPWRTTEPFPS